MAQEATKPRVLPNTQAAPKAAQTTAASDAVAKKRNKRATITDRFRPESSDQAATQRFDAAIADASKHWEHIVSTLRKHGVKVETHFSVPKSGTDPEGGEFTANVLAYPLVTVLQLAQSRQHNKLMDGYSDPSEPVLPTIREIDAELTKGVWSQRGEGVTRYTLLERAVAEMNGRTPAEAREALEKAGIKKVSDFQAEQQAPFKLKMAEIQQRDAQERIAAAKDKAKGVTLPKLF